MPSFLYRAIDKIILFTWGHWPAIILIMLTHHVKDALTTH